MTKKKNIAGFTLIELLVVIAIIALLLSILLPGLKKAKEYARRVICAGRLSQIGVAMKLYADTYKEFLPTNKGIFDDGSVHTEMHGYVAYRKDWISNGKFIPLRFARLYETGLIDMPEIFYCPNNYAGTWKYESYTNPAPWGTLDQVYNTTAGSNQWVRIGLTYYPVERNAKLLAAGYPDPDKAVTKYTNLNLNIPYATDVLHTLKNVSHQSNSTYDANNNILTYGKFAVNALYGDAHVSTCTDQAVFKNTIWNSFGDGTADSYDRCYYTIFKLIGP
jgi:prepilin-type N-terminal cleavage/methylation domain-containing protein